MESCVGLGCGLGVRCCRKLGDLDLFKGERLTFRLLVNRTEGEGGVLPVEREEVRRNPVGERVYGTEGVM